MLLQTARDPEIHPSDTRKQDEQEQDPPYASHERQFAGKADRKTVSLRRVDRRKEFLCIVVMAGFLPGSAGGFEDAFHFGHAKGLDAAQSDSPVHRGIQGQGVQIFR